METNWSNAKKIYDKLIEYGFSVNGACGLIGNIIYESAGCIPNRVEFLLLNYLGNYTDESYTAAVDSGAISKYDFLHPRGLQYGYGLCQWTYAARKEGLYDLCKKRGVSIADIDTQIDYLYYELSTMYTNVLSTLMGYTSIRNASDVVLKKFEMPADTSESMCETRAALGLEVYRNCASAKNTGNQDTLIEWMKGYLGISEHSEKHREILRTFNNSGLCTRYTMTEYDAWCATFVSAAFIATGMAGEPGTGSVFECVECYCESVIQKAITQGIWVENDAYVPSRGDIVLYDWDDSGAGDCQGLSDHIGVVTECNGKTSTVIEGNMHNTVGTRTLAVNGRYIRGYITPNYGTSANTVQKETTVSEPTQEEELKKGSTGEAVKRLQRSLIALGYYCGSSKADGDFGANTEKALKKFQKAKKLKANGIYTAETKTKMLEALKAKGLVYRVVADVLNIRKGPGTGYDIVGTIEDYGTYTIIKKKNGFGQLLSGDGWISMDWVEKV